MATSRTERRAKLRGAQTITLLYSILFVSIIGSGYYLLFQENVVLAFVAAILIPALAWGLARYIGSSEEGIPGHRALFGFLMLISAFGVFNSLMLNLEGRQIFTETIQDSRDRFDHLGQSALAELSKGGSDSPLAHMRRVESLKAALFSEIRNPLNCGQGPEARKILANLRAELTDFRPLSNPRVDCSQNDKVINDYDTRITALVSRAPWNNAALVKIVGDSDAAKKDLDRLERVAGDSFAPTLIGEVKPALEDKNSEYRDLYDMLPSHDESASGVQPRLELGSVESLGEWSQAVHLLINR